eukprot:1989490-Pleurochrysis_carterae.AAC.1
MSVYASVRTLVRLDARMLVRTHAAKWQNHEPTAAGTCALEQRPYSSTMCHATRRAWRNLKPCARRQGTGDVRQSTSTGHD